MSIEALAWSAFEARGTNYGTNPDDAKMTGWAGTESEALPVGNGQHGQKTRAVVPQVVLPVLTKDLEQAKTLRDIRNEPITLISTSGVRVLCPSCSFASASDLGDDYVTFTYTLGGDPIQL